MLNHCISLDAASEAISSPAVSGVRILEMDPLQTWFTDSQSDTHFRPRASAVVNPSVLASVRIDREHVVMVSSTLLLEPCIAIMRQQDRPWTPRYAAWHGVLETE